MRSRAVSPFGSGPFHETSDYMMPARTHPSVSQSMNDHNRFPFDDTHSASSHENYIHTPESTAAVLAFTPWLLDVPSASLLFRTSSLSGSKYVSTPPSYMEHSPMYPMVETSLPPLSNHMVRDSGYINGQELAWQPRSLGGVTSQSPLPLSSLPMWHASSYEGPPMPPMGYQVQSFADNMAPSFPHPSPETRTVRHKAAGFKPSDTESSTTASDSDNDDSEYEDSSSRYSKHKGSRSNSGSNHSDSQATPVLKLGRWSMVNDPFSHPPQRHYVCGRIEHSGPNERHCDKSFQRPEHLRRHIKTVHGNERNYRCKVAQCGRAFSRGDNLRDHYWTHIQRGGRAGKNDKMSLVELKAILGPKEKKLLRRLKHRLSEQQAKLRSKL
jgi:hypothetical protein